MVNKYKIKVIANAKHNKIEINQDTLKVHLTKQPIKGKANEQLIKILADYFKIKKSLIKITKGLTSNKKEIVF